jgi:hypothetical protein
VIYNWWYPSAKYRGNDSGQLHWRDNYVFCYVSTEWWCEMISPMREYRALVKAYGTRRKREGNVRTNQSRSNENYECECHDSCVVFCTRRWWVSLSRHHFSPFFSARDLVGLFAGTTSPREFHSRREDCLGFLPCPMRVAFDVGRIYLASCRQDSILCYRYSVSYVSLASSRDSRYSDFETLARPIRLRSSRIRHLLSLTMTYSYRGIAVF